METLQFLNDISPWWWVAFALALGALEMATMSFFLIWPALSALIVAGLLAMTPSMTPEAQISTFSIVAVILTVLGRIVINRYGDGGGEAETSVEDGDRNLAEVLVAHVLVEFGDDAFERGESDEDEEEAHSQEDHPLQLKVIGQRLRHARYNSTDTCAIGYKRLLSGIVIKTTGA